MVDATAQKIYSNRVRLRVCGLCWEEDRLLLVNHKGLYQHDFWAPPGGGIGFGETLAGHLEKEFQEETGLTIQVRDFQFTCEFVQPPLHAVEMFFNVVRIAGKVRTGHDPEMGSAPQIIEEVRFLSESEINALPESHKHGLFRMAESAQKIRELKGYVKIYKK